MRELFCKAVKLLICMTFLMSSVSVFAGEDAPLFEKYGYRSSYKYNDEMIANGLKSTVPQIRMTYSATIQYEPVTFDGVYAAERFEGIGEKADKALAAGDVAAAVLDDMRKNTDGYLTLGYQQEMKLEGMYTGGGVVIGEDGYIATNSPVVGLGEKFKKDIYYHELREDVESNVSKLITGFEKYNVSFSDKEIDSFCRLMIDFAVQNIQIVEAEVEFRVLFPNGHGETGNDAAKVYEAEVVAHDMSKDIEGSVGDTAILKIDAKNLVALKLSEKYPELNSKIVWAGFHDAADKPFRGMDSEETDLDITVKNGSVARLNPIDGTKYKAIGITCTLFGGNSGGPSVDANLDVEGLNTYVNEQDNPLGNMVPARLLKNLSSDLEIGQGEVSKTFMTGLQMLQDGYGSAAVECFRRVAKYQPQTPYINNLIELAEAAPDNRYVEKKDNSTVKIIVVTVSGVICVALVIILIVVGKGKKKTEANSVDGAVPLYPEDDVPEGETLNVMTAVSEDTVPIISYKPPVPEDAPRPVIPSQHTGAADTDLR